MPAQPAWFHRLEEILEELRALDTPYLDRLSIEKLFGVQERRARQLMAGLPGIQVGNAVAVARDSLLARLDETADCDRLQWEVKRRARVAEELDRMRLHLAARRVRIASTPDAPERLLQGLSSDIKLQPGALRIEFHGAEDLAAKLFELSQAMANDWPAFSDAVED